jgi:hypothetical protein
VFSYLGGEGLIEEFVLGLEPGHGHLPHPRAVHHLPARLAAGMERDHHHLRADLPAAAGALRVDPIFFGILVALNLQTSFLTPPMAMAAYYLKGIAPPHVQLMEIFKGCLPFVAMVFIAMARSTSSRRPCSGCRTISTGCARMTDAMQLNWLSATDAARAIRDGAISSEQLVRACWREIDEADGEVQAWAHLDAEHALAGARADDRDPQEGQRLGPLHGVPSASRTSSTRGHADRGWHAAARGPHAAGTTPPWSRCCARPARSSWARRSPPNAPTSRRARRAIRTTRATRRAVRRAARRRRLPPAWCRSRSAARPTAR